MRRTPKAARLTGILAILLGLAMGGQTFAQKRGGVLIATHVDNPPSASIHEEGTSSVVVPFMSIFNNLVLFDQHQAQHRLDTVVPELATSWRWNEAGTALTFLLRDDVRFHDGKPMTSADVKCTWDMVSGLVPGKLRKSPRKEWYGNLERVSVNGDREVTFHLKRLQPSFLALLASGWSPVYPCHVTPAAMRTKPIGTGPFRLTAFNQNENIRLDRNPDYWKPGLPYLDAIEFRIVPSRATRMLGFIAGKFDITHPSDVSVPLLRDIRAQAPAAQCVLRSTNVTTNLIVNRDAPPFDRLDMRMALALALDRSAFNTILNENRAAIGASMLPPPEGVWGMPDEMLATLPGYDPDVEKSREKARSLMRKAGYGPDKRMALKIFTRDLAIWRDPALLLADQLKSIYIDAELDPVETSMFYNRVFRKEYSVGLNLTGSSLDDPDQNFYENYACGSLRNYTAYCNKAMEAMFERQSMELDLGKRKELVWEIERGLAADVVRPVIFHNRAAMCAQSYVRNLTVMVNSVYNGWRWEDLWLDK